MPTQRSAERACSGALPVVFLIGFSFAIAGCLANEKSTLHSKLSRDDTATPQPAPASDADTQRLQALGYLDGGSAGGPNVSGRASAKPNAASGAVKELLIAPGASVSMLAREAPGGVLVQTPDWNTEQYDHIAEDGFIEVSDQPLSTFSIDVDTAAYSNVRRYLTQGRMPPTGAVRVEELINYFSYSYPRSDDGKPFSVAAEVAAAPWQPEHRLLLVGLKGRELEAGAVPPRNLVFLLDVSGSMASPNKLALVQYALRQLTGELRPEDHVSIVVYAGASGLVLEPTSGRDKTKIADAIDRLGAGGSTNGGQGIQLAYETAREHFDAEAINRVILATDGDFNVGVTDRSALVELIEKERESGVFLTVLGVGEGNLHDATMEELADRGNGNYAYLDTRNEARKVLVQEASGTLVTIAKDVKIQVEFNPAAVTAYRLIGYENRRLANRDFNDDRKDAGEIGAGHSVTALYEVVPVGAETPVPDVDPLRYQKRRELSGEAAAGELATVKLRFKAPDGDRSELVSIAVRERDAELDAASDNLRFAAAVAAFGMSLRSSEHRGNASFAMARDLGRGALGADPHGYRSEFVRLSSIARELSGEDKHADARP